MPIDSQSVGRASVRQTLLFALIGIFSTAGTIALGAGLLFTIGGFTEQDSNLTSWFGGFAGFILIGVAAIMYMAALLAYIAHLLASAIERQPSRPAVQHVPISRPILSETPRPPWYAQPREAQDAPPTPPATPGA